MAGKSEPASEEIPAKSGMGFVGLIFLAMVSIISSLSTVFLLTPNSTSEASEAAAVCEPTEVTYAEPKPLAKSDQVYVEIEEVLITIGSAPATRYLKMNVSIVSEKGKSSAVKNAEPMLVDAFVSYLRAVELSDFEDPSFYPRLREQLARRSELVLGSSTSHGILITEFLLR